jgi:hypothetical protein
MDRRINTYLKNHCKILDGTEENFLNLSVVRGAPASPREP